MKSEMSDKIYYKISNTEIFSDKHFYKMYRYVFFKTLVFCIDIYPTNLSISFLIAANNMSIPSKCFKILELK